MNYLLPERLDALARAYALGTLSPRAERRFAQAVANSAAAAQAVARWREVLGTLELGAPPTLAPSDEVWSDLQKRLFERPQATPAAAGAAAGPGAAGRRPVPRGGRAAAGAGWLGWPALAGLLAGALLFGGYVQWRPQSLDMERMGSHAPASYVGVLSDEKGKPLLSTIARRHGRVLTVRLLRPVALGEGEVLTVWAWNDVDTTPRRVGSWAQSSGTAEIALPGEAEVLLAKMTHLGLGREPASAESASPSGPLLAQGPCAKVW
jgi:anti-sigma-K factor RskA